MNSDKCYLSCPYKLKTIFWTKFVTTERPKFFGQFQITSIVIRNHWIKSERVTSDKLYQSMSRYKSKTKFPYKRCLYSSHFSTCNQNYQQLQISVFTLAQLFGWHNLRKANAVWKYININASHITHYTFFTRNLRKTTALKVA